MLVNEIFHSLQGEGKGVGIPNIFIRLTGCNLRCRYCDTKYAYFEGTERTIDEIVEMVGLFPCKDVCITGGEPLIQEDIMGLVRRLIESGYQVCIETNGSVSIEGVVSQDSVMISLDIKLQSSGMGEKMRFENIDLLRRNDQLKMIVGCRDDFEEMKRILEKYKPSCEVIVQPVWGMDLQQLAEWILGDGLPVRLGVQLHKLIWGEKRGV